MPREPELEGGGGFSKGNHGLLSIEDGGTEGGAEEGGVINCT